MTSAKHLQTLSRKLFVHKIIIMVISLVSLIIGWQCWNLNNGIELLEGDKPDKPFDTQKVPYYEEIMKLIKPLQYSAVPSFKLQTDISLSIDFNHKTWTLHKFHQYKPNGEIVLDYGRYGLCGELASYVYSQVSSIFNDRYIIKFADVAQSGFFLNPGASHVVLLIYDKISSGSYIIDPSLHRYGPIDAYNDYLISSLADYVEGVNNRDEDVTFPVDTGMPLVIFKNFISILTIESCNGKFDKDNFIMAVRVNRRFQYVGENIFIIQTQNGHVSSYENKEFESVAISSDDFMLIKKTLNSWFHSLENDESGLSK